MRDTPRPMIGTTEACRVLDISKDTLRRLIESGELTVAHKNPGPNGVVILWRDEVEKLAAVRAAS